MTGGNPDFNPMIIIEVVLIVVAVWQASQALRWMSRQRTFGATAMEIEGPVPVPLGRPFKGRLRSTQPLAATGDFRITFPCFDIHEMRNTCDTATSHYRNEEFPVWSKEITLPASTDDVAGLPFHFDLPASVGSKPVRALEQSNQSFTFKASINIPGLRRIVTHNAPPVGRQWILKISAPMTGTDFRADFITPVRED